MKVPPLPGKLDRAAAAACIMWSIKEDLRIYASPAHGCDVLGTGVLGTGTLDTPAVDQSIFMMIAA